MLVKEAFDEGSLMKMRRALNVYNTIVALEQEVIGMLPNTDITEAKEALAHMTSGKAAIRPQHWHGRGFRELGETEG